MKAIIQRRLNTDWSVSNWNEKDAALTLNVVKQIEENACKKKFPMKHAHSLHPPGKTELYLYAERSVPLRKRILNFFS